MDSKLNSDVVVIGAGLVGCAIAYGLADRGLKVLVLDGDDRDLRASSANMGLVWEQGKGLGMPAYQQLTRSSGDLWPAFSSRLMDETSIDLEYERNGGLTLCLGEPEYDDRRAKLMRLHNQFGGQEADWEMLGRAEVEKLLPNIVLGPDVVGASFGRRDGHANPLMLLAALHAGLTRRGTVLRTGSKVRSLKQEGDSFTIDLGFDRIPAARIVIAAGLGSKQLAAQVGLDLPIRPQRGQILVTERIEPILPLPLHSVRQTSDGTIMIGSTHEEVGFDSSTTSQAASALSAKAIRSFPGLRNLTLVRQWAGLRIMTPDSYPIYAQSESHPGAFVATCHSGVTLAAIHAGPLADAIAAGALPPSFDQFHQRRFDVPKAA